MLNFLEKCSEIYGWIRIMLSPTLIGMGLGSIVYYNNPSSSRLLLGLFICFAGITIGIIWATRIYKSRKGTIHFLSRLMATPELDNNDDDIQQQHK